MSINILDILTPMPPYTLAIPAIIVSAAGITSGLGVGAAVGSAAAASVGVSEGYGFATGRGSTSVSTTAFAVAGAIAVGDGATVAAGTAAIIAFASIAVGIATSVVVAGNAVGVTAALTGIAATADSGGVGLGVGLAYFDVVFARYAAAAIGTCFIAGIGIAREVPPVVSPRGVRLYVQMQDDLQQGVVDGFRFTITAVDAVLMPNEIFRYMTAPVGVSPVSGTTLPIGVQAGPYASGVGIFDGVCSPPDLEEFPVGVPDVSGVPPYFRLAVVDLLLRSRAEAVEAFRAIEDDVNRLIRSMNSNDVLGAVQPIWIGAAPSGNPLDEYYWK